MKATISYNLSETGRKASILAGGDGTTSRAVEVMRDDPSFADVVELGRTDHQGNIHWAAIPYETGCKEWDAVPTVAELVAFKRVTVIEAAAKELAEKAARNAALHAETLAVLTSRRTKTEKKWPGCAGAHDIVSPDWPYYADNAVMTSPESLAWIAELGSVNEAAIAAAKAKEEEHKKAEAEEAVRREAGRIANRRRLGLGEEFDGDLFIRIEDGALTSAPVWENHKRGKNWLAIIASDPSSPGGLKRDFAVKAKGDSFYLEPTWIVGDAIEFGGDYYSGGGSKRADRWYGFVVSHGLEFVLLRKCDGGKTAIKNGKAWAKDHPTPAPTFTSEGGIKPVDPVTEAIEQVNGVAAPLAIDLTEVPTDVLLRELNRRHGGVNVRNGTMCPVGATL